MANSRKKPVFSSANPESEWFGFARTSPAEKTARVREVFASVAGRYDLMNDLMSGGLHRLWKDRLVGMMRPRAGQVILDIAGGTGDIALRCAARTEGLAEIVVCDINPAMLKVGRDRAVDRGWIGQALSKRNAPLPGLSREGEGIPIQWVTGNAEALPFEDRSADLVDIAFGLRNVTHIDKALAEFYRVLKPGGRFFCLEFSPGVAKRLKPVYDRYSFSVLPFLGRRVAGDEDSYRYLAESIRQFPLQPVLAKRMEQVGFEKVKWLDLMGGIAVIHSGWKL
jgi:demethylmenaquinone methyltransferase/2-methoxy-6-polyprenyl-1,4-benzoquinol methylase